MTSRQGDPLVDRSWFKLLLGPAIVLLVLVLVARDLKRSREVQQCVVCLSRSEHIEVYFEHGPRLSAETVIDEYGPCYSRLFDDRHQHVWRGTDRYVYLHLRNIKILDANLHWSEVHYPSDDSSIIRFFFEQVDRQRLTHDQLGLMLVLIFKTAVDGWRSYEHHLLPEQRALRPLFEKLFQEWLQSQLPGPSAGQVKKLPGK